MKPICLIAARGGSKGVKNKNTRMIGGKPLIAHTIEKAINSKIFQHVIVSSEDSKIISIAKKFGADVPFVRPKKLSTDSANMNSVLLHAINQLDSKGYKFDILVNRDCTVPFILNKDILGSVRLLKQKKCYAVFGAYKQHHNPYFNMMEINPKGFLEFSKKLKSRVLTRQSAPTVYQLNGLFTMDVKKFLKYETLIMPKILPYEIQNETGWMIDTEFEFKIAEMMFKMKYHSN